MERLFYIKFFDMDGKFMSREDYSGLQFGSKELAEKYIQAEKKSMEAVFGCKLKLNPYHKEVPSFNPKELIEAYCEATGFTYSQIVSKGRKREYVNVRMFITKSALDMGFVHGQLRPFWPNGLTYHYERSMNDYLDSGSITVELWKGYERKAMEILGQVFKEDGSGRLDESKQ